MPEAISQQLSDVPVADMVESLALGIAEAQLELDLTSARVAEMMTGKYTGVDGNDVDVRLTFQDKELSLLELGFTPTFYQFVETILEVKVNRSVPYWLTQILSQERCTFRRISKYCAALEKSSVIRSRQRILTA